MICSHMISLFIENTMCQPADGRPVRTTRIPQNSDSDGDHAHSSLNDRSLTSKCRESRAYVFGKDVSGDELCRENVELVRQCSRSSDERRRRSMVTFAEAPLRNGDTLVTIALKYGCRVSELKQLNRLISDQDVFGLRTIRVPVKRYGIVEELIRAEMEEERSDITLGIAEVSDSESSDKEMADDDDDGEGASENCMKQPLLRNTEPVEGSRLSKQARKALKHLHAVDSSVRTTLSAVTSSRTLRRSCSRPGVIRRRRQESIPLWNRIRWWVIVAATTFIILPLVFILFVKFVSHGS